MGNAVVHFEVGAADDGPLVAFYGELFGWELQAFPGSGYTMIDTRGGDGINGGIGRSRTGQPWTAFYVETDDPQATLEAANALGGRTVVPVTESGGVSTAMVGDPDGLLVGLVAASAQRGREPSAGPGEPVTWFEVLGSDPARTRKFYAALFGWTVDDSGFPGYASVDTGAGRGIQGGLGGGLQARWATVYVGVTDVGRTLSRAGELGGSRITDPSVPALKSAARAAIYGPGADMETGAFRDPAGNVVGVYDRGAH